MEAQTVGLIILVLLINLTVGGFATKYVVQFWSSYFRKTPVTVPFPPCAIAGLFLGELTIPLAVVTWLFSFVLK